MLGKKKCKRQIFYDVRIEDFVDEDDYYRKLKEALPDLTFLYEDKRIKNLYGTTGNPSLDPVIFFLIELVGYIENEISDRKLAKYIKSYMPARWFAKYDLDESTPVHSTISRTRQKMPLSLYKEIFELILRKCVDANLVEGSHQSQDTTLISANASLDSLEKKKPQLTIVKHYEKAVKENERPLNKGKEEKPDEALKISEHKPQEKPLKKQKTKSNKDYTHKYEPEAKIARKKSAKTDMYYKGNAIVDSKKGVITQATVEPANKDDRDILLTTIDGVIEKLKFFGLEMKRYAADGNFFSIETLKYLSEKGIESYIPTNQKVVNKLFKSDKFIYNKETDEYICPAGKKLKYLYYKKSCNAKIYKCAKEDCEVCTFKEKCTTSENGRRIHISEGQKYIKELLKRLKTPYYRIASNYRKVGTEGAFSQLKNQLGLRRFLVHGLEQVNKKFIMGTAVFNLKKLMKYKGITPNRNVKVEQIWREIKDIALYLVQFRKFLSDFLYFDINKIIYDY